MIPLRIKNAGRALLSPIVDLLIKMRITPNIITSIGIIISLGAGVLYGTGYFKLGAAVLIIGSVFDTFDGMIARKTNSVTSFGAFYDSVSDRFNEFFTLGGIAYFYLHSGITGIYLYCIFASLFFSIMVSYVRARGEGAGARVTKGLMTRVERVIYIIIISLLPLKYFNYMIILFTILTFITVFERIIRIKILLRR
ncbi:MAG: CDP-alcohol phosphatidyltransferase family protein [candidate division WOR-3 bacterium]|nr:CDP-alcohol phosphatidyltransferase family protein [candidate division WOR-3 bacterium]